MKPRVSLIFDVETTGIPERPDYGDYYHWSNTARYDKSRIVQICWILDTSPKIIRNFYVKPCGFEIPSEATEVHGITTEIATSKGITMTEMIEKLKADIVAYAPKRVVAHNLMFDFHVLLSELGRLDCNTSKQLSSWFEKSKTVCTMLLGKDVCKIPFKTHGPVFKGSYKNPRLTELYTHLTKKKMENEHDAKWDALACEECYGILRSRLEKKPKQL